MPTYEETEIDQTPPMIPSKTAAVRKASSPTPSPFPMSRRTTREGSPKVPSPYMEKKQLNLSQHSSSSSLNQLSDTDGDAYEPIADFLRENESTSSVPQPKTSAPPDSSDQLSFNPPSYPAPLPPKKSREGRQISGGFDESEETLAEDDDDGYTPVNLEGGQVTIPEFTDDVERAPLPLLSSSSTRSSLTWDSDHSSPMRSDRMRTSPSAPEIRSGGASIGGSQTSSPGKLAAGGGAGGGVLSSSPQNKWVSTSAGKVVMPPEPTSPPPSPPLGGQSTATQPVPITVKAPSPLLARRNVAGSSPSSISPPAAEQPKVPPKKRHAYSSVSREDNNDIYSFDSLTPISASTKSSPPKPSTPPPYTKRPSVDDDIYTFDTLEQAPPIPAKASAAPFQPVYEDENIYEFDNLEEVPPSTPQKPTSMSPSFKKTSLTGPDPGSMDGPPPIPKKTSSVSHSSSSAQAHMHQRQNYQFHDDPDVYTFDQLEQSSALPPRSSLSDRGQPPKTPPPGRSRIVSSGEPHVQMHDDDNIYEFDCLEPPSDQGGVVSNLSPATGQLNEPPGMGQRPAVPSKYVGKYSAGKPPGVPPKSSPPSVKRVSEHVVSQAPQVKQSDLHVSLPV